MNIPVFHFCKYLLEMINVHLMFVRFLKTFALMQGRKLKCCLIEQKFQAFTKTLFKCDLSNFAYHDLFETVLM